MRIQPLLMDSLYENLKLLSFNCRGFNDFKRDYLIVLLDRCDVLFLQEHWLTDAQIQDLNLVSKEHSALGVCGFDQSEVLRGRPYGGCAIFLASEYESKRVFFGLW